jgi:hypothetical protein
VGLESLGSGPEPLPPVLAGWKLTLPVPGATGHAATVSPAAPAPPWLTDPGGGRLRFWAPVDGATTPNSRHARTELIHLEGFPAGHGGPRTLAATVSVQRLPRGRPDVIIGQIHGDGELRSVAFVMLHYAAGAITAVVKQQRRGPESDRFPVLAGVPLGDRFDYRIVDNGDGTLAVDIAHAGRRGHAETPLPAAFAGAPVRFQAGAYQQATGPCGDPADGARVTFHSLRVDAA